MVEDVQTDLKVLFWNIKGSDEGDETSSKRLDNIVEALKGMHQANQFDILVLAECNGSFMRNRIEIELNMSQSTKTKRTALLKRPSKIAIFSNLPHDVLDPSEEIVMPRHSYIPLSINGKRILLVGVHLRSQYATPQRVIREDADKIRHQIFAYVHELNEKSEVEGRPLIDGVAVAGDFNMDPHDPGLVETYSFDATMSPMNLMSLNVNGRRVERFFNPSWTLHGNITKKVLGTFYMASGANNPIYFHMLDQVIFTRGVIDPFEFDYEFFEIISSYDYNDVNNSLIDRYGRPLSRNYSDHLPIKFSLTPKREEQSE
ncbi:hypothetical protein [Saccharibacillus sacchari]|uniref:Uncharacterized protein n=1 Tax=Saccharibacillus sacchari TaxID=456493 RepID=A0ACC6PDX6_9BACL